MVAALVITSACSGADGHTPGPPSSSAAAPGPSPTAGSAATTAPPAAPTPTQRSTPDEARADIGELLGSGCFAGRAQTSAPDPEDCSFGFFDGDTVVLYGDSHAAQWFSAAVVVAERHDWRLLPVTKADCPTGGERVLTPDGRREYPECAAWHASAIQLIEVQDPILVLVAARSDGYRIVDDDSTRLSITESAGRLGQALATDLRTFADMGARTILIRDTQVPGFDVPACIEADGPGACGYRLPESAPDDSAQLAAAGATGTPVVDLRREVCGARGECLSVIDGLITFRDGEHLTATFGASLADELESGIEALPA